MGLITDFEEIVSLLSAGYDLINQNIKFKNEANKFNPNNFKEAIEYLEEVIT